jgi:CRISPR system Cascade subunit CasD
MSTCFILLWLEAPLQSWGFDSKFSRRDTLDFPTKSGVLGLLCCALGAGGEQRELLATMAPLKTSVMSFTRKSKRANSSIFSPILQDFHMVGAGYDKNDKRFGRRMIPEKVGGGKATGDGGGVKLTYRYYLQDKAFAVALEVPMDLSHRFADALQNPVWDLYLGRKSCAPVDFIYQGVFDKEDQTVTRALQIADKKSFYLDFKVLDGKHEGERLILNDVPIQFGSQKIYGQRYVTILPQTTPTSDKQ